MAGPTGRITGEADIPNYPGEIAAAWLVIEKMRVLGYDYCVNYLPADNWHHPSTHHANFSKGKELHDGYSDDFPAEAICQAALRALGVPISEEESRRRPAWTDEEHADFERFLDEVLPPKEE